VALPLGTLAASRSQESAAAPCLLLWDHAARRAPDTRRDVVGSVSAVQRADGRGDGCSAEGPLQRGQWDRRGAAGTQGVTGVRERQEVRWLGTAHVPAGGR